MTAPDPTAVASVGAEAVEAAAHEMFDSDAAGNVVDWGTWDETDPDTRQAYEQCATNALAAALPHLRAQVLAEVDAALRAGDAFYRWWAGTNPNRSMDPHMLPLAADYLRDTLAGDGGEA